MSPYETGEYECYLWWIAVCSQAINLLYDRVHHCDGLLHTTGARVQ